MIEDQKQALTELLTRALSACGLSQEPIRLERPKQAGHGDLASTIALQCAKKAGKNPRELRGSGRSHEAGRRFQRHPLRR